MTQEPAAERMPEWEKALRDALATEIVGHPMVALDEVGSTNDVVKAMALHGAPDGLTVLARNQTNGRGRRGRAWVSFPGKAVYLSVLLRPAWKADDVSWLGVLGGVAVAEALGACGVGDLLIKWPNDVLARGRKIAGVLVEPRLGDDSLDFAVLGVGVNVAQLAADWPPDLADIATSCKAEGADLDPDTVAVNVLEHLDRWYRALAQGNRQILLDAWSRLSRSSQMPVID